MAIYLLSITSLGSIDLLEMLFCGVFVVELLIKLHFASVSLGIQFLIFRVLHLPIFVIQFSSILDSYSTSESFIVHYFVIR